MVPREVGARWGGSRGEGLGLPRDTRGERLVPRSKGGGLEVPGAEGRVDGVLEVSSS